MIPSDLYVWTIVGINWIIESDCDRDLNVVVSADSRRDDPSPDALFVISP
jgi:hypothetical protein